MAVFSFTIPAASVDSIKDTSGSTDFEAVADRGLSRSSTHRVLTAKFGDGYEQRVLDGINTKNDQFSISFNNREAEDINLIAEYLDTKAGLSFDFTITDTFSGGALSNSTIKVVCEQYNISYPHTSVHSLSANLRRVYEP